MIDDGFCHNGFCHSLETARLEKLIAGVTLPFGIKVGLWKWVDFGHDLRANLSLTLPTPMQAEGRIVHPDTKPGFMERIQCGCDIFARWDDETNRLSILQAAHVLVAHELQEMFVVDYGTADARRPFDPHKIGELFK